MAYAEIHEFTHENCIYFDDEGELLLGFYFIIVDDLNIPKSMMGPFASSDEAEKASNRAWERNDY